MKQKSNAVCLSFKRFLWFNMIQQNFSVLRPKNKKNSNKNNIYNMIKLNTYSQSLYTYIYCNFFAFIYNYTLFFICSFFSRIIMIISIFFYHCTNVIYIIIYQISSIIALIFLFHFIYDNAALYFLSSVL